MSDRYLPERPSASIHRLPSSLLSGPKGPDNTGEPPGDGMEPRIAKLEAHMEHVRSDLTSLKGASSGMDDRLRKVETGLATLVERVAHLPSKGFIISVVTVPLGVVAGVVIFAERLRNLFGM